MNASGAGNDPEINTVCSSFTAIEKDWVPEMATMKPPGNLSLFGGLPILRLFQREPFSF